MADAWDLVALSITACTKVHRISSNTLKNFNTMKHLFTLIAVTLVFVVNAQDDDYVMFQVLRMSPQPGHAQQLTEGLKNHNAKYHGEEGSEAVNVWNIMSGPRTGSMLWVKGPRTWTDFDTPLEADGHMADWWDNIDPHAEMHEWEYWGLWQGMSYMPEGMQPKVIVVRTFDIKAQKNNNTRHIWEAMLKVYKDNNMDMGVQIYRNWVNAGDERDIAIMWFHDSWASMDRDRDFWDKYEDMFDMDSREFFENWQEVSNFKGMEIWTLNEDLSWSANQD